MNSAPQRHVHTEQVMGTVVSFDIRGVPSGIASAAVAGACEALHRVDAEFSTYRATSAICRIDRGELDPDHAGDDVRWVLRRCDGLREETGGFFDARATGRLDPSALVKGWAVQRASDLLRRAGLHDHCVGAGGDVICRGDGRPEGGWRVGIQHPLDPGALAEVVALRSGQAVATSGLYERGDHILDPRTGATPRDLLSVTVIGSDLGVADAYATAAFAMGLDGPAWLAGLAGYSSLTIVADGRVLRTPDFPSAAPGAPTPTLVDPRTLREAA